MSKSSVFLAMILWSVCLVSACGPQAGASPAEASPTGTTTITPKPTSTPTEALPTGPQPDSVYSGPLIGLQNAAGGMISLKVSADGSLVERISLLLMDVKCEHFSSGMLMQTTQGKYPIVEGALQVEIPGIGKINVRFADITAASGTIHLLYKDPGGGICDMGQVSWTGKMIQQTPVAAAPATPSPAQPEPSPIAVLTFPVILNTPVPAPEVIRTVLPNSGDIQIVNDRIWKSGKQLAILGEIENKSSRTLQSMQVTVRILDSAGKVLAEKKIYTAANYCLPGERTPFQLIIKEPPGFAGYSLEANGEFINSVPEPGLKITEQLLVGPSPHVIGWAEIIGEKTVEYPNVIGIFYDAEGKVVGMGHAFLAAPGGILDPGARRPFAIFSDSGDSFDHYRLITDRGLLGLPMQPELKILNVQVVGGSLTGILQNPTSKNAVYPQVWAVFYDAQNQLLDVQLTSLLMLGDLPPDATAPFQFTTIPADYDHYELFSGYEGSTP